MLTNYEKETIIVFTEADSRVDIFTYNAKLKRKLAAYYAEHPEFCEFISENPMGGVTYKVSKKRMSILFTTPNSRVYTEEEKQALRDRLDRYRKIHRENQNK